MPNADAYTRCPLCGEQHPDQDRRDQHVDQQHDPAELVWRLAVARTALDELDAGVAAQKSRDFGRGIAHAVRQLRVALDGAPQLGCDACRVPGPLLTGPGTSGRSWVCDTCGTVWRPAPGRPEAT